MQSYIVKPTIIKKSQILEKENSFSSFSYRFVSFKNKNVIPLGSSDILLENIKGFEPGSKEYINFSENYFIRISEMNDLNFFFDVSKDTKKLRPLDNGNKNKFVVKGDICYQTASNVGNVCFYGGKKAFYNSHIRKLDFKKNKYYIFAILKSKFGNEQVDVAGSIKGVDNFREEYLLNTQIPFPTNKNNTNPGEVEELISLIVQNIIDKEEQIKEKNKLIDDKIETELKENQKPNKFFYSYPKIGKIKENDVRLDTGLFEKDFNKFDFLIHNYINGIFILKDKNYEISRGQNLQITNIGKSYYSDQKLNDKFYTKILSSNISEDSVVTGVSYLGNAKKLKFIEPEDIIFCSRGAQFGRATVFPEIVKSTITNIDNMHIRNKTSNLSEKVFICQFLRYLRKIKYLYKIAIFGNGSFSFTKYHLADLSFPIFPESKQKEIYKIYYHKVDENKDLTFDNYLIKEKSRNKQIGIFQLNMDILKLKDILENSIHKVVMDRKIEIDFNY